MLFTQKETTNSPSLSMICRSLNCRVFCNALSNISFNYFTWNNYQLLRHPTDSSAHQMPQLMSLVNSTHILSMLMPMTVQNSMSAWTESLQESKDVSLVWSTMNSQSSVMPQKMYLNAKTTTHSLMKMRRARREESKTRISNLVNKLISKTRNYHKINYFTYL